MKQNNPFVIGVTGGVGAGKSEVLSYLGKKDYCEVYELDKVAHDLQAPGEICYALILDLFGTCILDENKFIDREKLGELAFQNKEYLQKLNEIIHPQVMNYIQICIKATGDNIKIIVIEGALLIEAGYRRCCNEFWYVKANEEIRAERVISLRGYSQEKFGKIHGNQLSEATFSKECDVIIDNSKDKDTLYKNVEDRLKILLGE